MTRNELGELRRSQVITTFGPGAIVDFRVGGYRGSPVSVVLAGLDQWDEQATAPGLNHPQRLSEPRLERKLGVRGFRLPPVQPDESASKDVLVGVRFPRWLQCPRCDRLSRDEGAGFWAREPGDARRWCPDCSTSRRGGKVYAVPVRLVTACDNGHLDEFPWVWWAHGSEPDHTPILSLVRGRGSGIGSLMVTCRAAGCGQSRSLAGSFGESGLRRQCGGRRPWLESDESCTGQLRAVQRGASNLYFGMLESALSIPPWSDTIQQQLGVYWSDVAAVSSAEERRRLIEMLRLPERMGLPLDRLAQEIEERLLAIERTPDIREEEFRRFVEAAAGELGSDDEFQVDRQEVPPELGDELDSLCQVPRLREVRALSGFTRLQPWTTTDDESRIAAISASSKDWLPAVEIKGEGIFLSLDEEALGDWEMRSEVRARIAELSARRPQGVDEAGPSARLVLVHTLAHLLMAELSLECGYSYAALRERIYCSDSYAGLLLYTGTPDSEGTFGGLVRQGESSRFVRTALNALKRARWCANDPLCGDGRLSLSDVHNLAACYACSLAPETSCESFNRILDRGFVVGTPGAEDVAFFRELS